jgi:hypothetical protein
MTYVVCELHGGNAAQLVCTHIWQCMRDGRQVSDTVVVESEWDGSLAWAIRLCHQGASQKGYSGPTVTLHGDEGLEEIFEIEIQCPVCSLCLKKCLRDDQ